MEIKMLCSAGLSEALFGIGLSFGLTSGEPCWGALTGGMQERLKEIASRLCRRGGGEDKFLRQIMFWWDVRAPRYWWCEADTYKVGTTAQSESTMHRITGRPLLPDDFEGDMHAVDLGRLNGLIAEFNNLRGNAGTFLRLKNALPEGYLQRRIWTLSLANMKNIVAQRKNHRLPQWHAACKAFVEATPDFLRGMYE